MRLSLVVKCNTSKCFCEKKRVCNPTHPSLQSGMKKKKKLISFSTSNKFSSDYELWRCSRPAAAASAQTMLCQVVRSAILLLEVSCWGLGSSSLLKYRPGAEEKLRCRQKEVLGWA